MKSSVYRISLDVHDAHSGHCLDMKQKDTARQISITLTDGGFPYQIGEECYAVFAATKADGKKLRHHCSIEKNTILYEVRPQTTAAVGLCECEIKLYGSGDKLLMSPGFSILVSEDAVTDDEELESEDEVDDLTKLISEATTVIAEGKQLMQDMTDEAEGLAEQVSEAKSAATRANTAATRANLSNENAAKHASAASNSAEVAITYAGNAETAAQSADSSAERASTSATTAASEAARAEAGANSANSWAKTANTSAMQANAAATTANTKANAAASSAERAEAAAKRAEEAANGAGNGSDSGQNGNGGGITTNGKALLRTLLYGAVYDKDVLPDPATTIEAFLAELDVVVPDSGGTDEPDVPAEPDEPEKATYTVTYNLTSVTSSNTAASVTEGNSFTTVLSAASEIDTVTVKMGGVDITETAYTSASGIVTIPEVTGDIVITAKVVDNTVLYTIKDATIDGTRYVDTGVCIEDEEKDFTVVLNLTAKFSGANNKRAIFGTTFNDSYDLSHLMLQQYNTTVDGVAVYGARLAYPPTVQQAFISVQADQVTPFKGRVIITHAKDSEILTVYAVNDSNPSDSIATKEGMSLPWGLSDGFTHTVTIGSPYRGTMPGTIHEFTIYNRVWSADEISAYLA